MLTECIQAVKSLKLDCEVPNNSRVFVLKPRRGYSSRTLMCQLLNSETNRIKLNDWNSER